MYLACIMHVSCMSFRCVPYIVFSTKIEINFCTGRWLRAVCASARQRRDIDLHRGLLPACVLAR